MTTASQTTLGALLDRKGRDVFGISPQATVYDAIALMSDKSVGALLVMDGPRLLGIVSERDYTRKVILQGRSSKETRVNEIMTRDLVVAPQSMVVEEAMRHMTKSRVRHLPVMAGDEVAGVVSIGDLVKWMISAQEETITQLRHYIAGDYMA
ncbi:MAG: CBS domain-containing protein [Bryobacteraceae bacterium]|nr:CBS domain-containing protein [Bryobacteraceae bacterium]